MARDSFDYSLSMDDRDQPAKVLLDYMSGFNYQVSPRHMEHRFRSRCRCVKAAPRPRSVLHCSPVQSTALHRIASHCIALHRIASHCIAGSENMGGLPSAHVQVNARQSLTAHGYYGHLSSAAQLNRPMRSRGASPSAAQLWSGRLCDKRLPEPSRRQPSREALSSRLTSLRQHSVPTQGRAGQVPFDSMPKHSRNKSGGGVNSQCCEGGAQCRGTKKAGSAQVSQQGGS